MNLLQALSILLNGPAEIVGEGYKWKRSVLTFAIIGIFAFPLFLINLARPYQGPLPPQVETISQAGKFVFGVERVGSRQMSVASLATTNGTVYRLPDDAGFKEIREFESRNPDEQLHVSGFLLQGGKGFFWPLSVTSANGRMFLSPDRQLEALRSARNPFGWKLFVAYLIIIPFWWISFSNAKKIMQCKLVS